MGYCQREIKARSRRWRFHERWRSEAFEFFDRTTLQWSATSGSGQMVEEAMRAARGLGVQLHVLEARQPHEFERAFDTAMQEGDEALLILPSMFFSFHQTRLVAL